MLIASINVTSLTAERLHSTLDECERCGADVLALQETRHHSQQIPWARSLAAKRGWLSAFSEPPPLQANGVLGNGGTAILWRSSRGRASVHRGAYLAHHRAIAVKWSDYTVACLYGPAQGDKDWFSESMTWLRGFEGPLLAVGDFNWRAAYLPLVYDPLVLADQLPTTTAGTAPTRLLSTCEAASIGTVFLPGIPHHGFTRYSVSVPPFSKVQAQRLSRTASYHWHVAGGRIPKAADVLQPADWNEVMAETDATAPALPVDAPLLTRWQRWHARAEAFLQALVRRDLLQLTRKAERPKGSLPRTRPTAPGAAHRQEETIALRRLKRMARRLSERLRSGCGHTTQLSSKDWVHWLALVHDGLLPDGQQLTLMQAYTTASAAVQRESAKSQGLRQAEWRARFSKWHDGIWKDSKPCMKPWETLGMNVHDMASDWDPIWRPPDNAGARPADAWRAFAKDHPQPCCKADPLWLPSLADFIHATSQSTGSAGFDGWDSHEARLLAALAPSLMHEIWLLWCETTQLGTDIPSELRDFLWTLRVAGVPKGEGLESRPISVASIWARSWHKSLLLCFPPVPEAQWCCRTGAGVVQGTADWLARPCRAGMELDLSKAFDTLNHEVLRVALEDMRLPPAVVSMLLCAWRAPRICQAHGELAAPI